jgi:hypothetical protein
VGRATLLLLLLLPANELLLLLPLFDFWTSLLLPLTLQGVAQAPAAAAAVVAALPAAAAAAAGLHCRYLHHTTHISQLGEPQMVERCGPCLGTEHSCCCKCPVSREHMASAVVLQCHSTYTAHCTAAHTVPVQQPHHQRTCYCWQVVVTTARPRSAQSLTCACNTKHASAPRAIKVNASLSLPPLLPPPSYQTKISLIKDQSTCYCWRVVVGAAGASSAQSLTCACNTKHASTLCASKSVAASSAYLLFLMSGLESNRYV